MTPSQPRVAVVGAGIMGTATAAELATRGIRTHVFERFGHGHTAGSSHGLTRGFRLGYADADYAELATLARQAWQSWERRLSAGLLTPAIRIEHGDDGWTRALRTTYEQQSIRYEHLTTDAATRRFPGLRFEGDVLLQRDAAMIHAARAWWGLRRYAERYGCAFVDDTRIARIEQRAECIRLITADHATFTADVVIVAAGAWGRDLIPELLPDSLVVTQEQVLHFAPKNTSIDHLLDNWPNIAHRTREGRTFWSVATPGLGAKVSFHRSGPPIHPDSPVGQVSPTAAIIADHVASWMPSLDPVPVDHSTCLYTNAPDDRLLLGRRGRIIALSACSGHGFKFAPVIGQAAADLARDALDTFGDGDVDASDGIVNWMRASERKMTDRRNA